MNPLGTSFYLFENQQNIIKTPTTQRFRSFNKCVIVLISDRKTVYCLTNV